MATKSNHALFTRAIVRIPGGVNSPVRAFKAVGGTPPFIRSAKGAYLYDVAGKAYIEYLNAWGPMLLGHAATCTTKAAIAALRKSPCYGTPTQVEVELAELVCRLMPNIAQIRMVNSGTEATFSAIRLARAYTKRNYIIKFAGCYHGHADSFLATAGSGVATFGLPDSPGVPADTTKYTLVAEYNNLQSVKKLFAAQPNQVAALIVEPVAGNMGCIPPVKGFLADLQALCRAQGTLLIFDEVMTGFRIGIGGAQGYFGITPDITCLGKILGGGMPVAAYGGRSAIMRLISPEGPVYQAGTLAGHPVGMASGLAMLQHLHTHPEVYTQLATRTNALCQGLHEQAKNAGIPHVIHKIGSMFTLFFTEVPAIRNFNEAKTSDTKRYARFFHLLLTAGVYFPPSALESAFVSAAIDEECVEKTLAATKNAFTALAVR